MPTATVTELTAGGDPVVGPALVDVGRLGYEQAEYGLSGMASAYVRDSDRVCVADQANYATRLLVYRPMDPAAFNGTVWVEWLNVTGGFDAAMAWTYTHVELMRAGAAWVGVSAQSMGVHGGQGMAGLSSLGLVGTDPDRYGALVHPGDRYSYDIYSQAGAVVRRRVGTSLADLAVERVLAIGESQAAHRLATYANEVDPLARVFDGILVQSRGGFSAPLEADSEPVAGLPESAVQFGADRRVPVMCVQAETDVSYGGVAARQDDHETFVLWEVAGTSHADVYLAVVGAIDTGSLPLAELAAAWRPGVEILGVTVDKPINAGPLHYVMNAAVSHFDSWVRDGIRPPHAARLETLGDAVLTDQHGNARGGIRTPHLDAPTATLSGLGNGGGAGLGYMVGTTTPFDVAKLASLYPSKRDYLSSFDAAADAAVAAGFVLRTDSSEIKSVAAENWPLQD
jgi:hypothetical protein